VSSDAEERGRIDVERLDVAVHHRGAGDRVDGAVAEHHHHAVAGVLHEVAVRAFDRSMEDAEELPAELVGGVVAVELVAFRRRDEVAEEHGDRRRAPLRPVFPAHEATFCPRAAGDADQSRQTDCPD
jgi:hypothetical protein